MRRWVVHAIILAALAGFAVGGCAKKFQLPTAPVRIGPFLRMLLPAGGTITGDRFTLHIEIENFVLDPPGSPLLPGHGRIELTIDDLPPAQVVGDTISLRLGFGPHTLRAELVGNDGSPLIPAEVDSRAVTVSFVRSLSREVQPIFTEHCGIDGCHAGPNAVLGEDLSTAEATLRTAVNVNSVERASLKRIVPGNPETSYTVQKIRGDGDIVGGQMPAAGRKLNQEEVRIIIDWIRAGAPDN